MPQLVRKYRGGKVRTGSHDRIPSPAYRRHLRGPGRGIAAAEKPSTARQQEAHCPIKREPKLVLRTDPAESTLFHLANKPVEDQRLAGATLCRATVLGSWRSCPKAPSPGKSILATEAGSPRRAHHALQILALALRRSRHPPHCPRRAQLVPVSSPGCRGLGTSHSIKGNMVPLAQQCSTFLTQL